ncbi:hypothetical protein KGM_200001 [Danaus plexippus plexippus]|uniref:Uncharacterized protein n=1 Tax=Danaus plexippus plexippus TaxID=278856 RepID=A0A212EH73_DANPL|nr:hypothetical protein KGM_200001 [Danaus plexippus plexippus]
MPGQKTPAPEAAVTTLSPPSNPGTEKTKTRRTRKIAAANEAAAARRDGSKQPTTARAPAASKWTKVPNKKGQNKQQRAAPSQKKEEKRRNLRAPVCGGDTLMMDGQKNKQINLGPIKDTYETLIDMLPQNSCK